MRILSILLSLFLLASTTLAVPFYVSNKSNQVIDGVYAVTSGSYSYGDNIAPRYIYPGYYDSFYTSYNNVNYSFKITTSSGNYCTVSAYADRPMYIFVYNDGCILRK